ncbi:MAG: hypothetical protein IKW03_02080 [Clostridia bacterium]|nr:hypothetical protein [Clostridia bacterium]
MFLREGKEYYPLEISQIYGRGEKKIYNRDERKKAYIYIAVENTENKGEE